MSAIGPDDATILRFRVFLDDTARFPDQHSWLHNLNGLGQTLASCLDDPNRIAVSNGLGSNIVGLVQVAMKATMVEGHVEVENVTIHEYTLVRDAVADDLVKRSADRLGEAIVVQR